MSQSTTKHNNEKVKIKHAKESQAGHTCRLAEFLCVEVPVAKGVDITPLASVVAVNDALAGIVDTAVAW
jgi:hypothetical protein